MVEETDLIESWHEILQSRERMPNNPFPQGSIWGYAIDALYRRDRYKRC